MRLVSEVLDTQIHDSTHRSAGKVDGIVLEVGDDGAARVRAIEIGSVIRARRLGPRWERLAMRVNRFFGICRDPRYRIEWSHVRRVALEIELDLDLADAPPLDWERWLRERIISKVPFS